MSWSNSWSGNNEPTWSMNEAARRYDAYYDEQERLKAEREAAKEAEEKEKLKCYNSGECGSGFACVDGYCTQADPTGSSSSVAVDGGCGFGPETPSVGSDGTKGGNCNSNSSGSGGASGGFSVGAFLGCITTGPGVCSNFGTPSVEDDDGGAGNCNRTKCCTCTTAGCGCNPGKCEDEKEKRCDVFCDAQKKSGLDLGGCEGEGKTCGNCESCGLISGKCETDENSDHCECTGCGGCDKCSPTSGDCLANPCPPPPPPPPKPKKKSGSGGGLRIQCRSLAAPDAITEDRTAGPGSYGFGGSCQCTCVNTCGYPGPRTGSWAGQLWQAGGERLAGGSACYHNTSCYPKCFYEQDGGEYKSGCGDFCYLMPAGGGASVAPKIEVPPPDDPLDKIPPRDPPGGISEGVGPDPFA